jgi:hypothetical protein
VYVVVRIGGAHNRKGHGKMRKDKAWVWRFGVLLCTSVTLAAKVGIDV